MILEAVAMGGLLGVVVTKLFATKGIQVLKRQVAEMQGVNNKIKGELKVSESTRAAAMHELKKEERALNMLRSKINKYEKELASLKK